MRERLRVIIADDERPARSLLLALLRSFDDVEVVGEAKGGGEAVELIEQHHPDLALLDLQMPEVDGFAVVRLVKRNALPMVAFLTAYDQYAVRAFALNAIDYVLKPVEPPRLRETLSRAIDRLDRNDVKEATPRLLSAIETYESSHAAPIRRIPVRKKDEIVLLPVDQIASAIADGELLRLTTMRGEKHTIAYRLKDLEARLDPQAFIRCSRGALANISSITKVVPMPGGIFRLLLSNGQELQTSRFHSRVLRERLLRL